MSDLVPETKSDLEAAQRAITSGYPEISDVLGELVEWLKDCNWPVARVLAPFLASVGLPLVPHIDQVLGTDDETWKYWVIVSLIGKNIQLYEHYRDQLVRFAESPSPNDRHHELDLISREILVERGYYD